MLLRLIELLFLALFTVTVITQVVVPLWRGRPVFPLFGPVGRAEDAVAHARERADAKSKLSELRKTPKPEAPNNAQ